MATRKATPEPEPEPRPTDAEVTAALAMWRDASEMATAANEVEMEARRVLVDVLHRAGLRGIVL